jgi:uridine kinase
MPRPLIFVEGLWLLWPPQVRALFDLRVFLDCAESLRLERRLERDTKERGRSADSIHQQFRNVVAPMNERFVEVQRDWADLVIEQPMDETGLCRLVAAVRALRTEPDPALVEIFQSQKTKLKLAS